MSELKERHNGNLMDAFKRSHKLLSRAVALPISALNMDEALPRRVRAAIEKAI